MQLPLIFISATYVTQEDKQFALSLGAVRFIEKPIDTEDFLFANRGRDSYPGYFNPDFRTLSSAKILRALQDGTFQRLGGNETLQSDVRVLCATNRDLERAIAAGGFREDLYHRLNVVTLQLPPLRERRDDIPLLVDYFLSRYARAAGIERPPLAQNALDALMNYPWPGNVRELEHLIQRLMIFAGGYTIQAHDLPWTLRADPQAPAGEARPSSEEQWLTLIRAHLTSYAGNHACEELLEKIERLLIVEALRRSQGNQTHAARLLGLPRPTLHARMQKYGMHGREDLPQP